MLGDPTEPITTWITGVWWGWNHDITKYLLVQQEHLVLCLNLFMQEGVGRERREACATQQTRQPQVPISNKTFMLGQGGTRRLAHRQGWRKRNVETSSVILKKHDF